MHMADALLSPVIGGVFWAASGALIITAAKKIATENNSAKTPLMGVMGAFIFAAQMINFAIPGTGSSGHIGGGLLLSVLLGPWRAFITLSSVLLVQCLFFADGGLLALGCNIFNLAFFPAFIAYPFIYRLIAGNTTSTIRIAFGSIVAAVIGLQCGAFSVVIQTTLSGNSALPFTTFVLFMLPIHCAIGIVEGIITWAVLAFVSRIQPSLITGEPVYKLFKPIPVIITIAALGIGGIISYVASSAPDGLEWAIEKSRKNHETESSPSTVTLVLQKIQEKVAFLPDYGFPEKEMDTSENGSVFGTSVAGITGTVLVLFLAVIIGFAVRQRTGKREFS